MKKILFLNTIQDKAWRNRALFLILALVISMGNAWGADYTSTIHVVASPTGAGIVYIGEQNKTEATQTSKGQTLAPTHTYYIYANANQGYYFQEWTATNITLGNSSESSTTASIGASTGDGTSGTATAIFKPNVKITGASAEEIHATFNPAEDSQVGKTCVAVFNVENAESIADFVAPPTIGGEDSGKFLYQSMSYTNNKVTISFVYNGNKEVGDHTATLTLKVIDQKGGTDQTYGSKTITLIAHNEQEAVNEVSVTTAGGVTTEYATWAEGLAAANANAGCTLTLLRNIDLGTITSTNNITKAMTIDLNGKTLQAAVNKASAGLLTLNAAVEVTIKDSKTGGKIINEHALNGQMRAISIDKAGAILNIQSGTIRVNNTGQYASAANATLGVAQYSACTARGLYQNANTTVNISGGRIEAVGTHEVYGIVEASSAANTTYLNITGGEIYAEAPAYAYGICAFGKLNISGGTINTHINTNMVNALYAADDANNANNWYGYGIFVQTNAYATPSTCYAGTLTMTGGTVNVVSDRTKAATLPNYGIYINTKVASVGADKTATDGTKSEKASAAASIENATINVTSGTNSSYGVVVRGSYNSYDKTYRKTTIRNSTINVKANTNAYGVYADAVINSSSSAYGAHAGKIELTGNNNITATTTDKNALCVYVHAVSNATAVDVVAAEVEITSGTYKAIAANTTAYAVHSAAKQTQGEKEEAPSITINGGKFWAEASSTYADISSACVPGYCVIMGGFYKNNANVSSVLQEGYNIFPLQQNKAEHKEAYNEGYRWHVTNNFTGEAVWEVYNNTNTLLGAFDNLNSALVFAKDKANSKVVPTTNYTLPAGEYTIPSGVTLLVPYNDAYTVEKENHNYLEAPAVSGRKVSPYRTLTLDSGVKINVDGDIVVGAQYYSSNGTNPGGVCAKYGFILMNEGSLINLNVSAKLYAWGYISGDGQIIAAGSADGNSGANLYEMFQITDFRGGNATVNKYARGEGKDNKVFPILSYYMQNIEAPLTLEYGANLSVDYGLYMADNHFTGRNYFIGRNSSAMFNMQSGTIKRWYDRMTDRIHYELNGNCDLKNISIKVNYIFTYTINSNDYILPINSNMTINVKSGSKFKLTQDMSFLPCTDITIEEGATLEVNEGLNVYTYDAKDWVGRGCVMTSFDFEQLLHVGRNDKGTYGKPFVRTMEADNPNHDARLKINGEMILNGYLYTSSFGANICSDGGGKIIYKKSAGTKTEIWQGKNTEDFQQIPITAAQLHNGEEWYKDKEDEFKKEYLATAGVSASTTIQYANNHWGWMEIWKDHNGTILKINNTYAEVDKLDAYTLEDRTNFVGWSTEINETNQEVIHTAHYSFGPELDIVDADNTNQTLTINTNGWASSGWPYTINGTKYGKDNQSETEKYRQADRTLVIPYDGQPNDDMLIEPNDDMLIEVKDTVGTVVSCHMYKVPFVYTGTEDMKDTWNENSIVFVKSGTLTVGTASAKEIYVAPGAELEVTGTLDVKKLVLRTTPFDAAILTNNGNINGQVYYSRIAPNKSTITDLHGGTTTYNSARYYQFGLPLSCSISSVTMSNTGKFGESNTPYGNTWLLKSYNESKRAKNGISSSGDNWEALESTGTITAGVGYEMFSNSNYYREFYFPVTLPATATTTVGVSYTGGTKAEHNGWNIVCSPLTGNTTVSFGDPATAIKPCWLLADGSYTQEIPEIIPPAIPFAYQTSTAGTLNFVVSTAAAAPRRQSAAEALTETEWIHLDIFDTYGEGDETSLFVHPTRFEQTYKTGIDVAKQSLTAARPIIYSTHAYGDMAFAGVADSLLENGIDLVVYSPSAQELTFSLRENKFLNRLEYLWLADNETGARTDLLMDDYTCRADAGTIKGRFVLNGRFKAPQISTGIGNTQTDYNIYAIGNNIAISGVEQGTPIYVFDAVGHMIYTTAATSDEVIVPAPCAGVYMLSVGGQTAKLVINK